MEKLFKRKFYGAKSALSRFNGHCLYKKSALFCKPRAFIRY